LVPPLGPLLAQFLSGLANDFLDQLNMTTALVIAGSTDLFGNLGLFDELAVRLAKVDSESGDFAFWLSFLSRKNLIYLDTLSKAHAYLGLLKQDLLGSGDEEQLRVYAAEVLEAEKIIFITLNLYLSLCGLLTVCLLPIEENHEGLVYRQKPFTGEVGFVVQHFSLLSFSTITSSPQTFVNPVNRAIFMDVVRALNFLLVLQFPILQTS
jgi:hypothetical protein